MLDRIAIIEWHPFADVPASCAREQPCPRSRRRRPVRFEAALCSAPPLGGRKVRHCGRLEAQIAGLQPAPEREQLLMKRGQLDTNIDEWLSSPGALSKPGSVRRGT
jgi:hypothetical protein